jgi:lipoprotein signal peptidase
VKKKEKLKKFLFFLGFLGVFFAIHNLMAINSSLIVKNQGMSFGITVNLFLNLLLFLIFIVFSFCSKSFWLWILLLGAAGNLLDRLFFGYVRDYWPLPIIGVFNNINDYLITIGALMFIIDLWRKK